MDLGRGILIQDPTRKRNIFIPAGRLQEHVCSRASWTSLDDNTVTFVIPDRHSLVEEIPAYVREAGEDPAVMIQDPAAEVSYYLSAETVDGYVTDACYAPGEYDVSFVMPAGMELIEELPEAMKGMLQSGENVWRKVNWSKAVLSEAQ